jgi:hypothetical protein
METIKINNLELRLTSRVKIYVDYERGSYPISEQKVFHTDVYKTNLRMEAEGIISAHIAQVINFKGDFTWAGTNWSIIRLEIIGPSDLEEKEGKYDLQVSVTFLGGTKSGMEAR